MDSYLELSKADRQGDQPVVEEIQVLEVDQAAKISWQLLQLVLTKVQLHQVCEATEIRLGPRERPLKPGAHTLWFNSRGVPKLEALMQKSQLYLLPAIPPSMNMERRPATASGCD